MGFGRFCRGMLVSVMVLSEHYLNSKQKFLDLAAEDANADLEDPFLIS